MADNENVQKSSLVEIVTVTLDASKLHLAFNGNPVVSGWLQLNVV
jgi:hypothetical protein